MGRLTSLARYLRFYLGARLGWLWWGTAAAVGVVTGVVRWLRGREDGARAGGAVAAGMLGMHVTVVLATTVFTRPVRLGAEPSLDMSIVLGRIAAGNPSSADVANVLMLLPVGLLLPVATGCNLLRVALAALSLSICIECSQFVARRGWFELSDVALNVAGAVVGWALWAVASRVRAAYVRRGGGDAQGPRHMRADG